MQKLWFGAGVTDDLNRMVRIGQRMSPRLRSYIRRFFSPLIPSPHYSALQSPEPYLSLVKQGSPDTVGDGSP